MSCSGYQLLISRYLDDGLSRREREALVEHLGNCPGCAATLARYRSIEAALRKLPASEPVPSVRENLLRMIECGAGSSALNTGNHSAYLSRKRLFSLLPATLAAILIVGFAGLLVVSAVPFGATVGSTVPEEALWDADRPAPALSARAPEMRIVPGFTPLARDAGAVAPEASHREAQSVGGSVFERVLRQVRSGRPIRLPVPAYLPAGMRLERFSLETGSQSGESEGVEVAYGAKDGKKVRIRRAIDHSSPAAPEESRRLVVSGQEWWLENHPAPPRTGVQAYIIFTREDDEVIVLDAILPLDELVRIAESIEWLEEGR